MAQTRPSRRRTGWRWFGLFWAAILIAAAAGAITLQKLGPPANTPQTAAEHPTTVHHAAEPPAAHQEPTGHAETAHPPTQPAAAAAPTLPPDAPRMAVLIAGFGQSEKDSRTAIDTLPGPIAFAVSAYAPSPAALDDAARAHGHELLASVPMEPEGYPLNDAGPRALMSGATPEQNRTNLEWTLAHIPGAIGATAASDGMRGERFAEVPGALDPMLDIIARHNLLYIDPRPGRTLTRPDLASRTVDLIIDDPGGRADIEAKLVALERIARDKGTAIGLASTMRPVTLDRIAAWSQSLQAKGLALVPISALVQK